MQTTTTSQLCNSMAGFDLDACFAHPPDEGYTLRQKKAAPTKKLSDVTRKPSKEIDDHKPETKHAEEKQEAEWPLFIQKALKGIAERARPQEPTLLDRETLQIGSGSIAQIDEGRLNYNSGLWLANQKAVRITDKYWWLPYYTGEEVEHTPWTWVEIRLAVKPTYSIDGRTLVKRDQLIVMVMGKTKRPVAIIGVDPANGLPASAKYLSNMLDILIETDDLFSGNKILLE